MYLNDAAAAFPDTALEAVRRETQRVYEAAIRIILDGLGLKKADVVSDVDLEQAVAAQKSIHSLDIDAMYERHIKVIYSAIVAFVSNTAFSRQDEHSAGLQWLREASTHLVEAVKDTGQLQENTIRYVGYENRDMREAYNRIRVQIGLIVRDLEEMRASGGGVLDVLSLDVLKLQVNEDQNHINQTMTRLVGKHAITPVMGSSLINDSVFARDISMNLIDAAQTLFVSSDHDLSEAAHDVGLDENELMQVGAQAGLGSSGGKSF